LIRAQGEYASYAGRSAATGSMRATCRAGGRFVGIYRKYILPRCLDVVMQNCEQARLRAEWVPLARGDVLEVGIGSGLNLAYYTPEVRRLIGVDPSPELLQMASRRAERIARPTEWLSQSAEQRLPIENATVDTVVMTWVLCSISSAASALAEVRRVMKPGARLIFLEHGRSPETRIAAWQDRLTPAWRRIAGGCTLNRDMNALITGAGFKISMLQTGYMVGPKPMTYMYKGIAEVE
jgi:ubiquinone/menaquinone biosynthesis C-methylase UbiE